MPTRLDLVRDKPPPYRDDDDPRNLIVIMPTVGDGAVKLLAHPERVLYPLELRLPYGDVTGAWIEWLRRYAHEGPAWVKACLLYSVFLEQHAGRAESRPPELVRMSATRRLVRDDGDQQRAP